METRFVANGRFPLDRLLCQMTDALLVDSRICWTFVELGFESVEVSLAIFPLNSNQVFNSPA